MKTHVVNKQKKYEMFLHKIPFHERIIFTKDQRCLENYQKHQNRWKKTVMKVCRNAKKRYENSVVFRHEQHRKKIEIKQALEMAKPLDEKYGSQL